MPDDLLWGSRVSSEHPAPHPGLPKLTKTWQHLVSVSSYLKTPSNTSNKSTSAILLPQNTVGVGFGNTHSLETISPSIQAENIFLEHTLYIQRCLGFDFKPAASKLIQHLSPWVWKQLLCSRSMKNADTLGSFAAAQDHDQQTELSGYHFSSCYSYSFYWGKPWALQRINIPTATQGTKKKQRLEKQQTLLTLFLFFS